MPGIAGIITSRPRSDEIHQELLVMLRSMCHEKFYTWGKYEIPELGCYFGWVAHSCVGSDSTLVTDATADVALMFSGEHFAPSAGGGDAGRTQGAASVMAAYKEKGDTFVGDLNGWFAGVLVDRRKKRATLFNDRYGVGRVYWTESQGSDSFIFSSEAKALLAICPERQSLDQQALGQYVTFGSVFQNRTLFSNVFLLPGGSLWNFSGTPVPAKGTHFSAVTWEQQTPLTPDGYCEALKATVTSIVPSYCRSDKGVGISLTGGLDTRMIMAALPKSFGQVPCYTYGGHYRDCFDVRAAAEIARIAGHEHQVLGLEDDFFCNFAELAARTVWLTDGTLDICGTHELYFSARARRVAPIRITGNYGSEVLRGVSTFKSSAPTPHLFTADLRPYIDGALEEHAALRSGHPVTYAVMNEIPWHLYGRFAAAQSQLQLRSPYMDNELVGLAYRAPRTGRERTSLALRVIAALHPGLSAAETDMGISHDGSQARWHPRRVIRYMLFKAEWYYNFGLPRWAAGCDRLLLRPLEPLFLGSHKIEHYRVWFRDQLADYIEDSLSSRSLLERSYVNRTRVSGWKPKSGISGQDALDISRLLSLELVQTKLLKARPLQAGGVSELARSMPDLPPHRVDANGLAGS
jgi:asparagine synthase (glutamine-hydrolysing)